MSLRQQQELAAALKERTLGSQAQCDLMTLQSEPLVKGDPLVKGLLMAWWVAIWCLRVPLVRRLEGPLLVLRSVINKLLCFLWLAVARSCLQGCLLQAACQGAAGVPENPITSIPTSHDTRSHNAQWHTGPGPRYPGGPSLYS
jgi:hypothetical protein